MSLQTGKLNVTQNAKIHYFELHPGESDNKSFDSGKTLTIAEAFDCRRHREWIWLVPELWT